MLSKNIICFFIIIPTVLSVCCFKKRFKFDMIEGSDKQCIDFGKAKPDPKDPEDGNVPATNHLRCRISICGNGKRPEGSYCGIGKCNIAGCNCDGGCVPGNALEEYTSKYGIQVNSLRRDKVDELLDLIIEALNITS